MPEQHDLFGVLPSAAPAPVPTATPQHVLPFKKYKGQPYEVLLGDPDYALWLMSSMHAQLQAKYPALLAFLVSRFGVPDRTPDHNRLQNRFLDDDFAIQFALAVNKDFSESARQLDGINLAIAWDGYVRFWLGAKLESIKRQERWHANMGKERAELWSRQARIAAALTWVAGGEWDAGHWSNLVRIYKMEFEKEGADVAYEAGWYAALECSDDALPAHDQVLRKYGYSAGFRIEVKPLVGDDYPAILRAMKAVKSKQMLVGEYCGAGATWDEVVRVFGLSGITAVLLNTVESTPIPEVFKQTTVAPLTSDGALAAASSIYTELTGDAPPV